MLRQRVPGDSQRQDAARPPRRRRRIITVAVILIAAFAVATGRLAARYHWRSIALVAIRPQDTRARIRLGRCFGGKVYVVTAPIRAHMWPYEIAYEWGATINALVFQRSC